MMRKIMFEEAGLKQFLAVLRPLWTTRPTWLIGEGELSDNLAAAATKTKTVSLRRGLPPPDAVNPLLIFTETDGAALQSDLLACLDLTAATVLAPLTDRHFTRQPLFLISIPKAGTHLIYELARALGYRAGIEVPEFPHPQTWYCLEYSNSHTVAADFFVDTVRRAPFGNRHHAFMKSPSIFIYRHPLDILVSEAHYYHLDGKSPFAGWFAGLDFPDRAKRLLNGNFLLGSLRERVGAFVPWLDFPNVISLSYEELVGAAGGGSSAAQLDLIWSILLKLQIPGDPEEIATVLFNRDAATFRSGQIGSFARELSATAVKDFAQSNQDIMTAFGYSVTEPGRLPDQRDRFRRRPVSYTKADFDSMPITIEAGFMECNLVRYARRIYAVPLIIGNVDLASMPASQLEILPSGPDIATVKALLISGLEAFSRHREALRQLGASIRGSVPSRNCYAYWTDSEAPGVVETYKDFNIVYFRRRFYGIRQTLGPIELDGDMSSFMEHQSVNDFVVAGSVLQLRDEIDGLSTAQRLRRHVETVQRKMEELDDRVATVRQQTVSDIEDVKTRVTGALTHAAEEAVRQGAAIDSLAAAYRETAVAASQAQDQLIALETEIAALRGTLAHYAAEAAAAARAHTRSLQRQIAKLRQTVERSIALTKQATAKAESTDATIASQAAALAAAQERQHEALEQLRGEVTAQQAESARSTNGRLTLQLEELIRQRGILDKMQQSGSHRPSRWLQSQKRRPS